MWQCAHPSDTHLGGHKTSSRNSSILFTSVLTSLLKVMNGGWVPGAKFCRSAGFLLGKTVVKMRSLLTLRRRQQFGGSNLLTSVRVSRARACSDVREPRTVLQLASSSHAQHKTFCKIIKSNLSTKRRILHPWASKEDSAVKNVYGFQRTQV